MTIASNLKLRPDWKEKAKKSFTIHVALFWSAMIALQTMWPVFEDKLPLWVYIPTGMLLFISITWARLRNKTGPE